MGDLHVVWDRRGPCGHLPVQTPGQNLAGFSD
jgi:hypothetical protein